MNHPHHGFTLIEVLVAMAVFTVSLLLVNLLISSMHVNVSTGNTVNVNQAGQEYLERTSNLWRGTNAYGVLDSATPRPDDVTGYTWKVSACSVNPASFTACTATPTTQPNTPTAALNTAPMVLLTVEYIPNSGARGRAFKASIGVSKP